LSGLQNKDTGFFIELWDMFFPVFNPFSADKFVLRGDIAGYAQQRFGRTDAEYGFKHSSAAIGRFDKHFALFFLPRRLF
jgi:hypothetical protein